MADFIWVESPGTQLQVRPRVRATRFGDGYEERAPDGLNPIREVWQLTFRAIDRAMADEIEAFLQARVSAVLGLESFSWVPLWRTTEVRVVCRDWQRVQDEEVDTCTVTAVFEREHVA